MPAKLHGGLETPSRLQRGPRIVSERERKRRQRTKPKQNKKGFLCKVGRTKRGGRIPHETRRPYMPMAFIFFPPSLRERSSLMQAAKYSPEQKERSTRISHPSTRKHALPHTCQPAALHVCRLHTVTHALPHRLQLSIYRRGKRQARPLSPSPQSPCGVLFSRVLA